MFALDPRIESTTVAVAEFGLSTVRLMNDRAYPWIVLLPRREGLRETHELDAADRHVLIDEIARASAAMEAAFAPTKINVAAIGNIVPQLHVHVIARFEGDPAWPGPVWGHAPAKPYDPHDLARVVERVRAALDATV